MLDRLSTKLQETGELDLHDLHLLSLSDLMLIGDQLGIEPHHLTFFTAGMSSVLLVTKD